MPASYKPVDEGDVEVRVLEPFELVRIAEIDRTEQIDAVYVQRGTHLELQTGGDWSAPAWDVAGVGEHSVAGQRAALEELAERGGIALGAIADGRLVGIGVVLPRVRPEVAQLAYLHVSAGCRARGIGGRLSDELERIAREAGHTAMVVSATPSLNTVRFYRRRGFEPLGEPLPELLELEPDDVHMEKKL